MYENSKSLANDIKYVFLDYPQDEEDKIYMENLCKAADKIADAIWKKHNP